MQYLCEKNYEKMNTIGLGNALVDVLLRLENDDVLSEIGIQKGAMDMINREQMIAIRTTLAGLPRTQTPGGSVCNTMRSMSSLGANSGLSVRSGMIRSADFMRMRWKKRVSLPILSRRMDLQVAVR